VAEPVNSLPPPPPPSVSAGPPRQTERLVIRTGDSFHTVQSFYFPFCDDSYEFVREKKDELARHCDVVRCG
jgi:hypothetical protein